MVWCSAEELARLVAAAAALKHSPAPGWLERVEAASHAQLGGCRVLRKAGSGGGVSDRLAGCDLHQQVCGVCLVQPF